MIRLWSEQVGKQSDPQWALSGLLNEPLNGLFIESFQ